MHTPQIPTFYDEGRRAEEEGTKILLYTIGMHASLHRSDTRYDVVTSNPNFKTFFFASL